VSLTPRTLAWSATAVAVAILVQAAVITAVVVKEQGNPSGPGLASAPNEDSYAVVRFAPQATANDITNFLGAYKATVIGGPLAGQVYRIRLSETKLPKDAAALLRFPWEALRTAVLDNLSRFPHVTRKYYSCCV
jgi:hypothetical protein